MCNNKNKRIIVHKQKEEKCKQFHWPSKYSSLSTLEQNDVLVVRAKTTLEQ